MGQLPRDPAIAVTPSMLQRHFLYRRPHHQLFFHRTLLPETAVEPRPAHPGQLTHPCCTQTALHRHHFPDLVVDACAPLLPLFWRRASILCKAPCKKSTSSTFSAKACFSFSTSLASAASRVRGFPRCGPPEFSRSRHRSNPLRSTPSSLATVRALSPWLSRSTAARQNSIPLFLTPRSFAIPSSCLPRWGYSTCLTFGVHSNEFHWLPDWLMAVFIAEFLLVSDTTYCIFCQAQNSTKRARDVTVQEFSIPLWF